MKRYFSLIGIHKNGQKSALSGLEPNGFEMGEVFCGEFFFVSAWPLAVFLAFPAFLCLSCFSVLLHDLSCFPCFSLLLSASLLFQFFLIFCACVAFPCFFVSFAAGVALGLFFMPFLLLGIYFTSSRVFVAYWFPFVFFISMVFVAFLPLCAFPTPGVLHHW